MPSEMTPAAFASWLTQLSAEYAVWNYKAVGKINDNLIAHDASLRQRIDEQAAEIKMLIATCNEETDHIKELTAEVERFKKQREFR